MTNNSNNNQFARFVSTSPLSSIPHDPAITLASNCIRDFFGPTVQLVADALMSRSGGCTLSQILSIIETKAYGSAQQSNERRKIMRQGKMRSSTINSKSTNGDRPSNASVRASLLALIQHSVVTVKKRTRTITSHRKNGQTRIKSVHLYEINVNRARLFPRYPRLVQFIKKLQDETAATLVEEILVQGRLRTVQAIVLTVEQIQQQQQDDTKGESTRSDHRYTSRQAVLESFLRLTRGGFLERVPHIQEIKEDDDEGEMEFDEAMATENGTNNDDELEGEDPTVVSLLRSGPYKNLPPTAIWRVNTDMFHEQLRAVSLGWLVAERYNHKIQSSGSIVTAALKLAASYRHGNVALKSGNNGNDFENIHNFTVEKILRYLPKTVVQSFEKREGGVVPNIYKALMELTRVTNPAVVEEVEVAPGQPAQSKFQIQTQRLVEFLRDRIVHQVSFLGCILTMRQIAQCKATYFFHFVFSDHNGYPWRSSC